MGCCCSVHLRYYYYTCIYLLYMCAVWQMRFSPLLFRLVCLVRFVHVTYKTACLRRFPVIDSRAHVYTNLIKWFTGSITLMRRRRFVRLFPSILNQPPSIRHLPYTVLLIKCGRCLFYHTIVLIRFSFWS